MSLLKTTNSTDYPFLRGGGEMGQLTRSFDWSTTSLGTPELWPASLQITLGTLLRAKSGMALFWGKDLLCMHNDAYRSILGTQKGRALGKPAHLVWADQWSRIQPLLGQAWSDQEASRTQDQSILIPDSEKQEDAYWRVRFSSVVDEAGQVVGVLSTAEETTEFSQHQQALKHSQEQFYTLVESAPVAIALFEGPQFTIELANERVLDYWGRTRQQVMHKPLFEALPEASNQGFEELLRGVYTTGERFVAKELTVNLERRGKLEPTYIDFVYEPFRQADGQITGVLVLCTEVTEQVLARRQVEASEAKLRSIIATAPAAMGLFVGRDLVVELPNQTFIDIVGKGPAIEGKPLREVMPELISENQPFLQILDQVFTSGEMFQSFGSMVQIVRNGVMTNNYYNITYTPLRDETGQVYAILDIAIDVTEQIQAQQDLAEKSQELELAIAIANLGTFKVDLLTQTATYSQAIMEWFGLTQQHQPVTDIYDRIYSQDRTTVIDLIERSASGADKGYHDVTYRIVNSADGQLHYLRSVGQVSWEQGVAVSISGIIQDVTQELMSRQALEESEERFRNLVNQAPVAMVLFQGPKHVVELANEAHLKIWGRQAEQVLGKPLFDALPEAQGQGYEELLTQVMTTGESLRTHESSAQLMRQGQLERVYFNSSYQPWRNVDGQITGVAVVANEVTEQVLARQRVATSEAALRSIVESAPFPIAVYVGSEMRIELANQTIMDVWGKGYGVIGKSYKEILPELNNQAIFDQVEHVLTTGIPFKARHQQVDIVVDGQLQPYYFNYDFTPLFDEQGTVYGVMNTAAEVTDLIVTQQALASSEARYRNLSAHLEQQVQQRVEDLASANEELAATTEELTESNGLLSRSNENLERFAYVASHDLQEPLRKIQQFGDLLKTHFADSTGREGLVYLERMQSAAVRMSTLIKDLLNFSRISAQREVSKSVSLDQVVQTALQDLDLVIEETGAQVDVKPLPTVMGNAQQLGQLFSNLLSNALKFRRPGVAPVIELMASQLTAEQVPVGIKPGRKAFAYHLIKVIDNGIGFDEKYLDRMFEVFQRLHGRAEYGGTGIGLAICEKVVANHGGAITAHSQPNQGATFEIYLPV